MTGCDLLKTVAGMSYVVHFVRLSEKTGIVTGSLFIRA